MKKIAVVYWSGTGNTEMMAESVAQGVRENEQEVQLFTSDDFKPDMVQTFEAICFGCPSMGAEELEETSFDPMFSACEALLKGKHLALFGSYGWGDGEWMRNFEDRCRESGAILQVESIICQEAPDETTKEELKQMGKKMSE